MGWKTPPFTASLLRGWDRLGELNDRKQGLMDSSVHISSAVQHFCAARRSQAKASRFSSIRSQSASAVASAERAVSMADIAALKAFGSRA